VLSDGNYYTDPDDVADPTQPTPDERRSVSLNCRVPPSTRAQVQEAAEWASVSPSDWLRAVVDSALAEYQRLRFEPPPEPDLPEAPIGLTPIESSVDYERRVHAAAAEIRSQSADRLVAPIRPTETPRSKFRFENPRDCPHLPTSRRAGGRCADCGGNIGKYLQWGRTQ
jgi:hypothetical protein